MQSMQRAAQANNEIAQAEAALQGLERENERLAAESETARGELESLGAQRGQVAMNFESVTERLKRLEAEILEVRQTLEQKRQAEVQSRRRGDELRAEMATLMGRRSSLESLIREHSYSTDTVRNLFRANAQRQQSGGIAPVGTLADFLEVEGQYESVVDEFLRDELNYIVVKSWDAADEGMRMLHSDVAGRATFLVHPNDAQAAFPFAEGMQSATHTTRGIVPLKDCIRVLDGFGKSLEVILPKLREGFVAPDSETARSLALSNPQSFFLSPSGETFHNVTVTGGRPREQGPLALKRDLAEVQSKLSGIEAELSQNELATAALTREITELNAMMELKNHQRREAEHESANSGAALRQMESETARIERRLQEWQLAMGRNGDQRQARQDLIGRKRDEALALESEREKIEPAGFGVDRTYRRHAREPRGAAGGGFGGKCCTCGARGAAAQCERELRPDKPSVRVAVAAHRAARAADCDGGRRETTARGGKHRARHTADRTGRDARTSDCRGRDAID